jgi:hypothetical protein
VATLISFSTPIFPHQNSGSDYKEMHMTLDKFPKLLNSNLIHVFHHKQSVEPSLQPCKWHSAKEYPWDCREKSTKHSEYKTMCQFSQTKSKDNNNDCPCNSQVSDHYFHWNGNDSLITPNWFYQFPTVHVYTNFLSNLRAKQYKALSLGSFCCISRSNGKTQSWFWLRGIANNKS